MRPVGRVFFARPPQLVAPELIGAALVMRDAGGGLAAGLIVEVEAYLAEGDEAAHGHRGRTDATAPLFMQPGTIYVHPMRQRCGIDLVTEAEGRAGSVLVRALEPIAGLEVMAARRGTGELLALASGPAKLTEALGITRALSGRDILDEAVPLKLLLPAAPLPAAAIVVGRRVGITRSVDLELRYALAGSRFVSAPRPVAASTAVGRAP